MNFLTVPLTLRSPEHQCRNTEVMTTYWKLVTDDFFEDKENNSRKLVPECLFHLCFVGARDEGAGVWWQLELWDVQSSSLIVTNNKQTPNLLRTRSLCVTQPTMSEHWRENALHFMDLLTPSSPWSLATLSLTNQGSWILWSEVTKPVISRLTPVPHPMPLLTGN